MSTKEFYEKYHQKGITGGFTEDDLGHLRFKKMQKQLTKYVKIDKNWNCLDIGCGKGEFLMSLPFKNKYGIDISENAINEVKKRGVQAYVCDVSQQKIPLSSNSMDVIFCLEILEHIFEADNLLSEIKRVLRPGGYLYLTVPNDVLRLNRRLSVLFGNITFSEKNPFRSTHIRFFSSKSLRNLFKQQDMNVLYCGALPVSFRGRSLGIIGKLLSDNFTDLIPMHYSLIAQKK